MNRITRLTGLVTAVALLFCACAPAASPSSSEAEKLTQNLTIQLLPTAEAPAAPSTEGAGQPEDAPSTPAPMVETPQPTPSYEGGTLTLPSDATATLSLGEMEGTAIALTLPEDWATATFEEGKLVVHGVKPGTATLTMTGTKEGYEPVEATLVIVVTQPPVHLALTPRGDASSWPQMLPGGSFTFQVDAQPPEAVLLVESDDPAVKAALTGNLLTLTATADGTATVTLSASCPGYENATLPIPVEVAATRTSLSLSSPKLGGSGTLALQNGETAILTAKSDNGAKITYTATGSGVFSVTQADNRFTVNALAEGSGKIEFTATAEGLPQTRKTVTVTVSRPKLTLTGPATLTGKPGAAVTANCPVTPADAVVSVSSTSPGVTASWKNGVLTATAKEPVPTATLTLTAQKEGYATVTHSIRFSAVEEQGTLTLSVSPTTLDMGDSTDGKKTFDITATATPSGAKITFTPGGNVSVVSQSGGNAQVVVSGKGTLTIHAAKEGYAPAERLLEVTNIPAKSTAVDISSYGDEVVRLVNRERSKNGLPPMEELYELTSAADTRAMELSQSYGHVRPNGQRFYSIFGVTENYYYGENVGKGQRTPAEVMREWMASSGHRSNILDPAYTGIGVGVYQKGNTIYWVQIFKNDVSEEEYTPPEEEESSQSDTESSAPESSEPPANSTPESSTPDGNQADPPPAA